MIGSASYGTPLWFVYLAVIISGYTTTTYSMCLTLHAQNHIEDKNLIGEGTSNIQFFQSLMGTVGNAILGMVLTNTFAKKLATVIPSDLLKYTTKEELTPFINANILANRNLASDFVSKLSEEGKAAFEILVSNIRAAYSSSLKALFIVASAACAIALVIIFTMNDVKNEGTK